ncbi:hypothetical protein ACSBR1_013445 [Camellia fascicularis]
MVISRNVDLVISRKIIKGGTHVDYVTNQITNYVMSIVNKKNKNANLKAHAVKNHLWVFVNALIDNPAFDSQTKETLTIRQSNFGSKCELSQEFLKKVSKSGIVESLLSWANFKQSKDLKKTDGTKRQRITGITKLEDANDAGGKSSDKCTLILTEGVSAKALAGKQKRNNRKVKDKGRDDKSGVAIQDILQEESLADERKDFTIEDAELVLENSDVSDSVDCLPEMQPDSEDRDTDTSEVHPPTEASSSVVSGLSAGQNGIRQTNSSSVVDDSSSTCSTDSVPSVVMNGSYKGYSLPNHKKQKSPSRGRNQRGKATCDATGLANEVRILAPEPSRDAAQPNDASESCKAESESEAVVHSLQDRIKKLEQHVVKKVDPTLAMAFSVARRAAAVPLLLVNGTYMKTVHSYLDSTILQHQLQRLNNHGSLKGVRRMTCNLLIWKQIIVVHIVLQKFYMHILNLLKRTLVSKSPLTDVFLRNQSYPPELRLHHFLPQNIAEKATSGSMVVKIIVRKSDGKALCAEAKEDFVDLLFSFLTIPLANVVNCLGGDSSLGCIDNLYKSVKGLDDKWFVTCSKSQSMGYPGTQSLKGLLLNPGLASKFSCSGQHFQLEERTPRSYYLHIRFGSDVCSFTFDKICIDLEDVLVPLTLIDPKSPRLETSFGEFVKRPAIFVVSVGLVVLPLSGSTSSIAYLKSLDVPIDDIQERVINISKQEVPCYLLLLNMMGV